MDGLTMLVDVWFDLFVVSCFTCLLGLRLVLLG